MQAIDQDEVVELYAASSEIEATRIVLLLDEDGVDAVSRTTTMTSFPSGGTSQYLILIRYRDRVRARLLIEAARRDQAITMDGEFLSG
jgi:hypothetical protein